MTQEQNKYPPVTLASFCIEITIKLYLIYGNNTIPMYFTFICNNRKVYIYGIYGQMRQLKKK